MIFRDKELKIVIVNYELTDMVGKLVQQENKIGILATTAEDALQSLRKIINKNVNIRINQISDNGCIHLITDNVVEMMNTKNKNIRPQEKKSNAGRPKGSPNKPKN